MLGKLKGLPSILYTQIYIKSLIRNEHHFLWHSGSALQLDRIAARLTAAKADLCQKPGTVTLERRPHCNAVMVVDSDNHRRVLAATQDTAGVMGYSRASVK
jgi:hypothetical protein